MESELYDITQPQPSALIESLRAFGYSLRTAIADLIDNSISAQAKNVYIRFEWNGNGSYIVIKDDGNGMSESELISAMRPGSKNPKEERPPKDLGRFGLGLKTASFSQCRRLTVASNTEDEKVIRCWDLDYINESQEWRLLKRFDKDPIQSINETFEGHGTIVLWEKMDRVIGINTNADDENAYKRFLEAIDEVKDHLAMVFHRYLEKPSGLNIYINDRHVVPWDPFLRNERATQELPSEVLTCSGKSLRVIPFVLPHQSKISKEVHTNAAGPQGWNAQQGFYVYRNERLLVGGDWLGLGFQKEEHYKLARIQIDIPNSMDSEWQIDVKKSRARPPGYLRNDLKRIARLTRDNAVQIYRHRGRVTARKNVQSHVFLWEQKLKHSKYFYSINREHPLVKNIVTKAGKELLEPLFKLLEETIPSAHIMITNSEEPDKVAVPFEDYSYEDLKPTISALYKVLLECSSNKEEALDRLFSVEIFTHHPEFVEVFKNETEDI